ncbi:MAG TPA: ATP-binding protein [Microvirga sp.]|nr:ATP-binding protein [Microvirga sp.]
MRLHIDSDFDKVALLARAVRALCAELLDAEAADAVEISLVEAVNNVIEHGYEGKPGRDVGVEVSVHPDRIVIEVVDQAAPMKSGALSEAASEIVFDETNIDSLPEGGMGLALIRMSMDEVEYCAAPGENRLRMVKRIPAPAG